jgi:lycopene cyclase domain-containing protein
VNHFQYLLLMAGCLALTLPLEFLGARVYRQPVRLARAVLPVALVFLVWDALAINGGVWTYNPRYVTGIRLPFGVPVEEAVFFLVVPVCGLLTYGCVRALLPRLTRPHRQAGGAAGTSAHARPPSAPRRAGR